MEDSKFYGIPVAGLKNLFDIDTGTYDFILEYCPVLEVLRQEKL